MCSSLCLERPGNISIDARRVTCQVTDENYASIIQWSKYLSNYTIVKTSLECIHSLDFLKCICVTGMDHMTDIPKHYV